MDILKLTARIDVDGHLRLDIPTHLTASDGRRGNRLTTQPANNEPTTLRL